MRPIITPVTSQTNTTSGYDFSKGILQHRSETAFAVSGSTVLSSYVLRKVGKEVETDHHTNALAAKN